MPVSSTENSCGFVCDIRGAMLWPSLENCWMCIQFHGIIGVSLQMPPVSAKHYGIPLLGAVGPNPFTKTDSAAATKETLTVGC